MKTKLTTLRNLFVMMMLFIGITTVSATETAQNRGLFAFVNGSYVQVSWRMRATDDPKTTKYLLYCGNDATQASETTLVGTYTTKTTVQLASSTYSGKYFRVVVQNASGTQIDEQYGVAVKTVPYLDIPLTAPAIYSADTVCISYTPGDCSAYDMDGDGEQEIILKWMPSRLTTQTGSTSAITSHGIYDCYKLDGTRLWRIDAGQNSNAGNNAIFYCWDFDGDGKGELILKTAPGAKDATGTYCGSAAVNGSDVTGYGDRYKTYYRGSDGLPTADLDASGNQTSQEWITVYSYEGKELKTKLYWPYFSIQENWYPGGKDRNTYGRRGCSQKGGVMKIKCLDGVVRPVAFMQRGAYTYVYGTAISWDGTDLKEVWRHESIKANDETITSPNASNYCSKTIWGYGTSAERTTYQNISLYAQGAHPSEVADLDDDGYDECCIGAASINDDGTVLWSTGLGHGDAVHVGELNPNNEGLEVFRITEVGTKYDACMIAAKTGEILNGQLLSGGDVGRGLAIDIDATHPGNEYVHMNTAYFHDCNGNKLYKKNFTSNTGYPNYRIYWDGDLTDEHFSDQMISKFVVYGDTVASNYRCCTPTSGTSSLGTIYKMRSINSTKGNPCLQCDLFGDWREELVMYTTGSDIGISNDYALRILTTSFATSYKLPWLRDDNTYNMEIACQNVGYSMPPHLSYNPVAYYEELGASQFGDDEVVKTATTWVLENMTTPGKDGTVQLYNKLYGRGGGGTNGRSFQSDKSAGSTTFTDGTSVSWTNRFYRYADSNNDAEPTSSTTANNTTCFDYLAINAGCPGTFYAICESTDNLKLYVNGTSVAFTSTDLSSKKELKYTTTEAATILLDCRTGGNNYLYALRFVPSEVTVTTNSDGYAVFTNTSGSTLTAPSGLTAYAVTDGNTTFADVANLTSVSAIADGTAVLLKGKANVKYTMVFSSDEASTPTNLLVPVTTKTTPAATVTESDVTYKNYILSGHKFVQADGSTTVAAGEAYLKVPSTSDIAGDVVKLISFTPDADAYYYISDVVDGATKYVNPSVVSNGYIQNCDYPYAVQFVPSATAGNYYITINNSAYKYLNSNGNYGYKTSMAGAEVSFDMDADGNVAIKIGTLYISPRSGYTDRIGRYSTPTYFTITEAPQEEVSMSVNSTAKFATFCAPFDVTIPDGVEAYKTAIDGGSVTLTEMSYIPGNTPVILYAENGCDKTTVSGYARYNYTGLPTNGALTGVLKSEGVTTVAGDYVLQMQNSKVAFYLVGTKTGTIKKNQAYITKSTVASASGSSAKALYFSFGDEPGIATEVKGVEAFTESTPVAIYNGSGMLITAPAKGLNIIKFANGRIQKVLVR